MTGYLVQTGMCIFNKHIKTLHFFYVDYVKYFLIKFLQNVFRGFEVADKFSVGACIKQTPGIKL